jgi:CRP-like cAMP-binding protein
MSNIRFVIENEFAKYYPLFEKFCPPPLLVPKNTDLCKQCRTGGWMYYMLDGVAKVYITNYDGSERIIDFMKAHTIIGMDCVIPGSKSVVSIVSITDIRVLPFNNEILKQMLDLDSEFAYDLVLYYGKVLRQVTYFSGNLGIRDLAMRLANFLFLFIDPSEDPNALKLTLTQDEIAEAINISRAQVAKILCLFRKKGWIKTGNHYIQIIDVEKLKKYCRL